MISVEQALDKEMKFDKHFYWTDSQISLAWIKSTEKEYETFVENRVQEIRRKSNIEDWAYVATRKFKYI